MEAAYWYSLTDFEQSLSAFLGAFQYGTNALDSMGPQQVISEDEFLLTIQLHRLPVLLVKLHQQKHIK